MTPSMWGWAAGSVVMVAVLVIVLLSITNKSTNTSSGDVAVAASVVDGVTGVPEAYLDTAQIAGNKASSSAGANPVDVIKTAHSSGNGLPAVGGKPVVFYFGALYCPYCATERWPLIVALSRFGTFSGLRGAVSSSTDVFPSTQTWSFVGSTYTSRYIVFSPVEAEGEQQQPLESLTAAETKVLETWDSAGSFPFITIGNKYTAGLPDWLNPQWLQTLSRQQIIETFAEPNNQLGQGILADANYLSAAICSVDGQQPTLVCSSKGVAAAAAQLPKLPASVPITSS
jgi:thiol-disulfide isomerase/thioredoxin